MSKENIKQYNKACFEYQAAIKFLTDSVLDNNGQQKYLSISKPLVMHSVRVAFRLIEKGLDKKYVVAAFLHDLVEDTDVTVDDVSQKFGEEVAELISDLTYNPTITDEIEKGRELIKRISSHSKELANLKAYDAIDNMNYYVFTAEDEPRKQKVFVRWGELVGGLQNIVDLDLSTELQNSFEAAKIREEIV